MKKYVLSLLVFFSAFTFLTAQTPRASYYDNGNKKFQGNLDGSKKVGEWKFYFENGDLQREGLYKDGKPYGVWKEYYKAGQVKSEGAYGISSAGKSVKHGDWVWYHKNGAQKKEGSYSRGKMVGVWREFNTLGIEIKKVRLE